MLRQRYRYACEQDRFPFSAVLETVELVFEEDHFVAALIDSADMPGGEIADRLTRVAHAGHMITVSLDRRAATSSASMELFA